MTHHTTTPHDNRGDPTHRDPEDRCNAMAPPQTGLTPVTRVSLMRFGCDLVHAQSAVAPTTSDPSGVAELKRGLMINCTEPLHDGQDDS